MSPQEKLTYDLENVTIDDGDLSDDYDFMDEDEGAAARRAQEKLRKKVPRHKYKDIMQQVADRKLNEIVIDLDDVAVVRLIRLSRQLTSFGACPAVTNLEFSGRTLSKRA